MISKMKKLLQIIAILFISFNLQAQNSEKARNLLDQVSAKVKSYSNISIDFKYSLTNPKENLNQESKGSVVMQGNKYVLNFMGITKIYDGKKSTALFPKMKKSAFQKQMKMMKMR